MSPDSGQPEQLTARQMALLRVLWERGEASVTDVHRAIRAEYPIARVTVATMLSRLARQGVVASSRRGREFVYRALRDEAYWKNAMIGEFSQRVFEGDLPGMVARLIRTGDVRPGDLEKVRAIIDEAEREAGHERGSGPSGDAG